MAIPRGYFSTLRGRKVVLEESNWGEIRIEFVKYNGDYKVKLANDDFAYDETIPVEIVEEGYGDVKFEVVEYGEDFEIFID